MKRRNFLKNTGKAGIITLITPTGILQIFAPKSSSGLENSVIDFSDSARPYTFWFWMNGNITKDGITKDLEAMHKVGIGGVLIMEVGSGIPKGPIKYLSPEWLELTEHMLKEANRLNMEVIMHNCPGWSSSGGPWITPEMAMQQVTWSETFVKDGKKIQASLPKPYTRLNYYRDTYVLAFPSLTGEERAWNETLVKITSGNGSAVDAKGLIDGVGAGIELTPESTNKRGSLLLEFSEPYEAQSVMVYGTAIKEPSGGGILYIGPVTLEASDDGTQFRKVFDIQQIGGEMPGAGSFTTTKAKYFRLLFPNPSRITQIRFSGAPRITDWTSKANFASASSGSYGSVDVSFRPTGNVPDGFVIDPASIVNVTQFMDAKGNLNWEAPKKGNWTILRFGYTPTGRINKAAPTTGEGLECDKFSKAAIDYHFDKMFGKLLSTFGPLTKKGLMGAEIDSYEVGMQNWTIEFPQEFQKHQGYDLLNYLPIMTGRIVAGPDTSDRFLYDLRATQADMMADYYYGRFTELCHQHKIKSYTEPYNHGPFEQIKVGSRMDITIGEFWRGTTHFYHSLKLVSSVQHVFGRKVAAAESFTSRAEFSKWQEYPFAMKAQGDYMFTLGLNRMIFHRYAMQPHPSALPGMTMGPWGIHFDRTNTWWNQSKTWLDYIARCQTILQQGIFVADVLCFVGEDAPGDDISMAKLKPELSKGYDYDYINKEALLNRVKIEGDRILLPDGMNYRVMVLPDKDAMTVGLLHKLNELVEQGMVLIGPKPKKTPGLSSSTGNDNELNQLTAKLWGDLDGTTKTERSVGKGRVFFGGSLEIVLAKLNIRPDFELTSRESDPAINYIHRKIENTDVYFVANRRRRPEELICTFRVKNRKPEFYNADTGEITQVGIYEVLADGVRVPVKLDPSGSVFVIFRSPGEKVSIKSVSKDNVVLAGTNNFPLPSRGLYKNVTNNFTISAWVKPEVELNTRGTTSSFAIYPSKGEALYGEGHAASGLCVFRNAIVVYERDQIVSPPILTINTSLAGWNHIALVYNEGVPSVYVNGNLAGQGKSTGKMIHPSLGEEYEDETAGYFEGEISKPQLFTEVLKEDRIKQLVAEGPPKPVAPQGLEVIGKTQPELLFWHNGRYSLEDASGKSSIVQIATIQKSQEIRSQWSVRFPPNLGAPSTINLPQLISLHKHPEDGVKYFSGTATYATIFNLAADYFTKANRIFLDLGRVEVIAELKLNGKDLGILWKAPFRIDITEDAKQGNNDLEVKVTNQWPNRLIGDEQLPPENEYGNIAFNQKGGIKSLPDWYIQGKPKPSGKRVTFTTWQHYTKDSPLLESGLVGPVTIVSAVRQVFRR